MVREAEGGALITVTRHDGPVAHVVGRGRMEAILETLELLADPGAMKAVRAYRKGSMKFEKLSDLR